jgi:hypothetical protein
MSGAEKRACKKGGTRSITRVKSQNKALKFPNLEKQNQGKGPFPVQGLYWLVLLCF